MTAMTRSWWWDPNGWRDPDGRWDLDGWRDPDGRQDPTQWRPCWCCEDPANPVGTLPTPWGPCQPCSNPMVTPPTTWFDEIRTTRSYLVVTLMTLWGPCQHRRICQGGWGGGSPPSFKLFGQNAKNSCNKETIFRQFFRANRGAAPPPQSAIFSGKQGAAPQVGSSQVRLCLQPCGDPAIPMGTPPTP